MREFEYYPQAKIASGKAARSKSFAKIFELLAWKTLLGGAALLVATVVLILVGSCTAAWVTGILGALMLLGFPAVALLADRFEHHALEEQLREKHWMQLACLHGEVSWDLYPGGYRFFGS